MLSLPFESHHADAFVDFGDACGIEMRYVHGLILKFCHKELGRSHLESMAVGLQMSSVRLVQTRCEMRQWFLRSLLLPCGKVDASKEHQRFLLVVEGLQWRGGSLGCTSCSPL